VAFSQCVTDFDALAAFNQSERMKLTYIVVVDVSVYNGIVGVSKQLINVSQRNAIASKLSTHACMPNYLTS